MKRNLALEKKVSNISKAYFVTDGDIHGSQGYGECSWPCEVVLDIEELCVVDTITLYLYDRDNRFYYYNLYISKDNKTWMKIVDNSSTQCRGKQIINCEQAKVRYIKVECLYNSKNRGFHIVQIEAYGEPVSSMDELPSDSVDITSGNIYDVFLSYSSKNQKEADFIIEDIKKLGGIVFCSSKSLKPGQDFSIEIQTAIKNSKELWILCSPDSIKSYWVVTELGAAWILGKKIIPILHHCGHDLLPDRLKNVQCINLNEVKDYVVDRFSERK